MQALKTEIQENSNSNAQQNLSEKPSNSGSQNLSEEYSNGAQNLSEHKNSSDTDSEGDTDQTTARYVIIFNSKLFRGFFAINVLKVVLSQKVLGNFYIANINIPNHYPVQKI